MSPNTVLRFADLRPERWRNGGGTTREIASGGDGPGSFSWRLSLADVERSGPFSLFPRCERILTVVDGEGMVLGVDGQEHAVEQGRPFRFSGDAAVTARLPAGPVRALNVITDRDAVRARVVVHQLSAEQPHHVPAGSCAVLISGRAVVRAGGIETELSGFDTVRGDGRPAPDITGRGVLAVVSLTGRGPATDLPADGR